VSLITQAFYAMIFCTRYLDIFYTPPSFSYWNFTLKIFYTVSSFYILYLMLLVYARTREREKAWKLGAWCLGGSLVTTTIILVVFPNRQGEVRLPLLSRS
jgi:ER lumen protein retaining receptor